jgi:hypothetical protein
LWIPFRPFGPFYLSPLIATSTITATQLVPTTYTRTIVIYCLDGDATTCAARRKRTEQEQMVYIDGQPFQPSLVARYKQIIPNGIVTCKSLKLLQIFTNGNAGRVESVASAQQPPRCRSSDSFDEVTRRAIVSKTAEPGEKWPMVFRHDNNSYPDSCDCRQRDQPGIDPHFHRRLHPKLFNHITPLLIVHIIIYGWH